MKVRLSGLEESEGVNRCVSRHGSPQGGSILMTSAPISARIRPASGPAIISVKSATLIPSSGPGIVRTSTKRLTTENTEATEDFIRYIPSVFSVRSVVNNSASAAFTSSGRSQCGKCPARSSLT